MTFASTVDDRWMSVGLNTVLIPERLLIAHARGEVLFITGAGTSMSSGLPDFRDLVLKAYKALDSSTHAVLSSRPPADGSLRPPSQLTDKQLAEVSRFDRGDYDVVLGMLERRIDGQAIGKLRPELGRLLRTTVGPSGAELDARPSELHRVLMRLADRGHAVTIATTNFDRLLQASTQRKVSTHSLGGIPRPGRGTEFAGVLHIHGVLNSDLQQPSEFIATDRDFGEFYLRRRVVPDFIYDAARLFNLVLVGYSANDAPMRYLLNAVAADGLRFDDLKERFAFVASPVPAEPTLEDWRSRGITPIPYERTAAHAQLVSTLKCWSELSAFNGDPRKIERLIKRIVGTPRKVAIDADRDLFDHLIRRGSGIERQHLAKIASEAGADFDWLDAVLDIELEPRRGGGAR